VKIKSKIVISLPILFMFHEKFCNTLYHQNQTFLLHNILFSLEHYGSLLLNYMKSEFLNPRIFTNSIFMITLNMIMI
jgi:hypothetical protein